MRARTAFALLVFASVAFGDAESFVRRARTRRAHGNYMGAKALLEQAIREDPCCGPALLELARFDRDGTELRLRYLAEGRPIEVDPARAALIDLIDHVVDLPEQACLDAERESLSPTVDDAAEGPVEWWADPLHAPWPWPAAGPLRQEARGSLAHRHRDALRATVDRFDREGIDDARCWAILALLQRSAGDPDRARATFARCRPSTSAERVAWARAAIRVEEDPRAWWSANGEEVLAGMRADVRRCGTDGLERGLCDEALALLAHGHDARRLAAVADVERRLRGCYEWRLPFARTLDSIELDWGLEEACSQLDGAEDSGSACLRASILLEWRHLDEATRTLEAIVRRDPSCVCAWLTLFHAYCDGSRFEEATTCVAPILDAGRQGDLGLGEDERRWVLACLRLHRGAEAESDLWTAICQGEARQGFRLCVDDMVRAEGAGGLDRVVEALSAQPEASGWQVGGLLGYAIRDGRPELVFPLVERIPRVEVHELGSSFEDMDRVIMTSGSVAESAFRGVLRFLRALASRESLSNGLEAALRQACHGRYTFSGRSRYLWALRKELEGDPEFLRLPSSRYVLSLLCDPHFEVPRARGLRREAYASGFRSRGLLEDLARDGEAVLDELKARDPVAALLVGALRSQGREALEAFLETDEADEDQIQEAIDELERRGVREPPTCREEAPPEWGFLRERPSASSGSTKASMGSSDDPDALARSAPSKDDFTVGCEWARRASAAAQRQGSRSVWRRVLNGPRPFLAATWLVRKLDGRCPDLKEEVLAAAKSHPMDLRWAELVAEKPASLPSLPASPPVEPPRMVELAMSGGVDEDAWVEQLVKDPDPVARFRDMVQTFQSTQDLYLESDLAHDVCLHLLAAKRTKDAIACVDAWAERLGPLTQDDRMVGMRCGGVNPPAYRAFSPPYCSIRVVPPKASAALVLCQLGRHPEAWSRMIAAVREATDEAVRWECSRAAIAIAIDWVFEDKEPYDDDPKWVHRGPREPDAEQALRLAVEMLHAYTRAPVGPHLRWSAGHWLELLCEVEPEVREELVDILLREAPQGPSPAAEEVSRWEARLAADDPLERDRTQEELGARGRAVVPLLVALTHAGDAEARLRARTVLESLSLP